LYDLISLFSDGWMDRWREKEREREQYSDLKSNEIILLAYKK
jgi:hypothetical protein